MAKSQRTTRLVDNQGRPLFEAVGLQNGFFSDAYHQVLVMRWPIFFALTVAFFVALHTVFAGVYLLVPGSIHGARAMSFGDAFFFSVQTLLTIGYGVMSPGTLYGNIVVTVEALTGVLTTAVLTGLVFAKFSRPRAVVNFSDIVCISNNEGIPCLMIRMANARGNRIIEAAVTCTIARTSRTVEGETFRRLTDLQLRRRTSPLFSISWTAMHEITPGSPLWNVTPQMLEEGGAELIVILSGTDETSSQTVHARRVYTAEAFKWGERFADMLSVQDDGKRIIDYRKFHDSVPAALTVEQ